MKSSMGTGAKAVRLAIFVLTWLCGRNSMAAPAVVRVRNLRDRDEHDPDDPV
jgi:hypothetical protein